MQSSDMILANALPSQTSRIRPIRQKKNPQKIPKIQQIFFDFTELITQEFFKQTKVMLQPVHYCNSSNHQPMIMNTTDIATITYDQYTGCNGYDI